MMDFIWNASAKRDVSAAPLRSGKHYINRQFSGKVFVRHRLRTLHSDIPGTTRARTTRARAHSKWMSVTLTPLPLRTLLNFLRGLR